MRTFTLPALLSILFLSAGDCGQKNGSKKPFKGRLEVAGICMNYTIAVLDENIVDSLVVENWTDEVTGKKYENVFRLGNPCDFPASLKAGDEFYFTIDTAKGRDCAVCMAYYPTPSRSIRIKVVEK